MLQSEMKWGKAKNGLLKGDWSLDWKDLVTSNYFNRMDTT